ncbi:Hypothetical Protein FCC1311_030952 [Hondaea fermentalgiana]|uniref:Uncharacterized protein n=1 Tax=Hondaea fermentalgiana TaxID=2315210 RepID=A0A2R5GDZ1_9STRA|nr:Hypothetical Protein FCC1311_030952 [Hondaea fermentalgiana]|eukprot:GBG26873.1 Hypothetical Protein FCC1311_030952 [Hondaea fermentalgiana]
MEGGAAKGDAEAADRGGKGGLKTSKRDSLSQSKAPLSSMASLTNMVKRAAAAKANGDKDIPDLEDPSKNGEQEDEELAETLEDLKFLYSNERMFVKGLVCWTLLVFVWSGMIVSWEDESAENGMQNDTSAILHVYQQVGYVLSVLLLLPSLFEMGFTWMILIGEAEEPTQTLIKKIADYNLIQYAARGLVLAFFAVALSLPLLFILIVFGLPRQLCRRQDDDEDDEAAKWWSAFYRLFGLLPDALLTWSLFPLSYFILMDDSGSSAMSVITDLVAVQIFATLDDLIVQMLLRPQEGLQSLFKLYAGDTKPRRRRRPGARRASSSGSSHPATATSSSSSFSSAAKRT